MGLAKMAPDGWRYYAEELVLGREHYFVRGGEEMGRWVGRGSEDLGLSGPVLAEGLERLFGQGCHPETGQRLGLGLRRTFPTRPPLDGDGRTQSRSEPVSGYALSFSPPKSVSLLWGLGDEEMAGMVRAAHDAAVASAITFLERQRGVLPARAWRGGPGRHRRPSGRRVHPSVVSGGGSAVAFACAGSQ